MPRTACALTLLMALAAPGCGPAPAPQKAVAEAARAPESPAAPSPRPDEAREILSLLSVEHEADILTQRDGVVERVLRDQGAHVAKGDELARLNDRDLVASLDKASAEVAVAENNVKYNEAELKAKQANFRRTAELREAGLQSAADYEKAEFEAKGAEYDLAGWRARVAQTQAEIRRLEVDLEKTRLRAPFAGVVARRYVREGQGLVKDDKCFRLTELSPLQVRFLVPETTARKPQVGDTVNLVTASDGGRPIRAVIRKVSPIVDPASASVEVMAELLGPSLDGLRPGMAVRVLWSGTPAPAP